MMTETDGSHGVLSVDSQKAAGMLKGLENQPNVSLYLSPESHPSASIYSPQAGYYMLTGNNFFLLRQEAAP